MRSISAGSLIARSASTQPSTGRAPRPGGGREPLPERVRHEAGLDRHPAGADRRHQLRPATRQVLICLEDARVGRLATRLDRVARVGKHDDLVAARRRTGRSCRRPSPRRRPGRSRSGSACARAGHRNRRRRTRLGEPRPESRQPLRPCGAVRRIPAREVGRRRCGRRNRPGRATLRSDPSWLTASCTS